MISLPEEAFVTKSGQLKEYEVAYKNKLINHIALVDKYASRVYRKINWYNYDKTHELFEDLALSMKAELTEEEGRKLDKAMYTHITSSGHHPEHWSYTSMKGFSRNNPTPNGSIEAYNMPPGFIEEMCAEWCADAEEKSISPFDWAKEKIGKVWLFSDFQLSFINCTLEKMWNQNFEATWL